MMLVVWLLLCCWYTACEVYHSAFLLIHLIHLHFPCFTSPKMHLHQAFVTTWQVYFTTVALGVTKQLLLSLFPLYSFSLLSFWGLAQSYQVGLCLMLLCSNMATPFTHYFPFYL